MAPQTDITGERSFQTLLVRFLKIFMVFEDRELIFSFREPSAAPQNDQEAMKFLKKSGSSSYDPSVQVNMSHKYES